MLPDEGNSHSSYGRKGDDFNFTKSSPDPLYGEQETLRPMTGNDWDVLLKWNSDPEVLYFSEGGDVASYNL